MSLERAWLSLRLWLRSLFEHDRVEQELDDELRDHIAQQIEENVRRGMTPAEARRQALLALGGIEQRKEEARDTWRVRGFRDVVQDARYAWRTLLRTPGFTVVAVLTLAIGIGANTAMFTVVNGVLLRPMPFPEADRLMLASFTPRDSPFFNGPMMLDQHLIPFREADRVFERITGFGTGSEGATVTGMGDPLRVRRASVTTEFFDVLRVWPAIGTGFREGDADPGRDPVVVASDAFWRDHLGASPSAIGSVVKIDGITHRLVGVMPNGFTFPNRVDIWVPRRLELNSHRVWFLSAVGRLKPTATVGQAEAELRTFADAPGRVDDKERGHWRTAIVPLKEMVVANVRPSLLVFFGAVGFVLLLACANVAHLLIARASARQQELAIRAALGAGRGRLVRQLLAESLVLALVGAGAGVVLAIVAVPALLAMAPAGTLPRVEMIHVDRQVLAFTGAVAIVSGILFGLAPAMGAARRATARALRRTARAIAGTPDRSQNVLVIAEVALALILVVGAGLLLKSFLRLRAVDPGFVPDRVMTMSVSLPAARYREPAKILHFQADALDRLAAVPGGAAFGAINSLPLASAVVVGNFRIEGAAPTDALVDHLCVGGDYFRTMQMPMRAGRTFTPADRTGAPGVVVISASLAHAGWPGADPIGKRLTIEDDPKPQDWLTVVGVVDDVKQGLGLASGSQLAVYQPYPQVKRVEWLRTVTFVWRATGDDDPAPALRAVLRGVDADLPPSLAWMPSVIDATTAEPRFQTRLIGVFASIALLLAAVGIYGVLSYTVALRTREIGIRIALGADRLDVTGLVLRRSLRLTATGIVFGIAGALALTRLLEQSGLLFDVKPTDPATFAAGAAGLLVVAIVAALVPARRARRVDPIVAMRAE